LQESLKTPGLETIYVNVKVLPSGEAAFAPVSLLQAVHVERNGQEVTDASTWDTGTLMTHFRATDLRDTVKDLVDQFLNDWLKQNPRR
jgi:hypothetical protein